MLLRYLLFSHFADSTKEFEFIDAKSWFYRPSPAATARGGAPGCEPCLRSLFCFQGRCGVADHARRSFSWLQRRKCFLRDEQLCRTHSDFQRGLAARTENGNSSNRHREQAELALFSLRSLSPSHLRIRTQGNSHLPQRRGLERAPDRRSPARRISA